MFAIALLIIVGMGVIGVNALRDYRESSRQVQTDQVILRDVRAVLSALKDAETGQRGYFITRDKLYLAPYESGVRDTSQAIAALEKSSKGQGLDAQVSALEGYANRRMAALKEVLDLADNGSREKGRDLILMGKGKGLMDQARAASADLEKILESRLASSRERGSANFTALGLALVATSAVVLVLVTAIYWRAASEHKLNHLLREVTRANADFLAASLHSLSAYVAVLDEKGDILVANQRWQTFVERHGEKMSHQLLGRAFVAACEPDGVAEQENSNTKAASEGIREVLEGRRDVFELEYPCQTKEGTSWFDMRVTRFVEQGRPRVVVAHIDVTHRKQAEIALAESEALQSAILASSLDCIITCDDQSRIIDFNGPAEVTFGYRREDVFGRSLAELIIPERLRDAHYAGMKRFLATRESQVIGRRLILTAMRQNGEEFPVELSIAAIASESDVQFTAYLRDISDQKRLEDDLRRTAADLSEANRRKTEFLAILAHELRNPLAPVRNAIDLMRVAETKPELLAELVPMLDRQVEQVTRLVDDLMDVGRITQGKIELKLQATNLADVTRQAVEVCEGAYRAKNIDLAVILPEQPLMAEVDPARIIQVISNLLVNASKFTPENGHVSITLAAEHERATIKVKDDGIGLAPEKLPYIFDLFMQVDHRPGVTESGLGIGLTLVKNLVELHGGKLLAQSEGLDRGAEFEIQLPMLGDSAGSASSTPEELPIETSPMKVLVIDDNQDAARVLSLLLQMEGFETAMELDGTTGLARIEEMRPEVVLCDIGLPGLTGYEVARSVRSQPWGQSIKLIALTGWGQMEDRTRTSEAGFDLHLVKPVERATLMKAIADLTSED